MALETCSIFLAEDNAADFYLIKEALAAADFPFSLDRASDGAAALRALEDVERQGSSINVIMLDLDLPKISGHELLMHVRQSSSLQGTPVIVLTSSDSPDDRARTAGQQISHYFRKPSNLEEFLQLGKIVQRLCQAGKALAHAG